MTHQPTHLPLTADYLRLTRVNGDETTYAIERLGVAIRRVSISKNPWWEAERNGHVCLFERLDDVRYFFAGLRPDGQP